MKTLLWLALPALTLAACQKAPDAAQGDASTTLTADSSASDSSASDTVTPASGLPSMAPSPTVSDAQAAAGKPGNDPATYLAKAGAGDLFEEESSRAILKTTQDPQIKSFARMMIADHEQSAAILKKAARVADLNVTPPALRPDQQQSLDAIKAAKGKDADHAYLGAQRDAHAAALNLHRTYAANGDTPQLKAAAARIVPVVEQHIAMLDTLGG